jgi:DNA-damage-inducible protein J
MTTSTTRNPKSRPKAKTGYINARVTPTLKHDAERVLGTLGVSTTEAITMFLRQVVLHQGLPFPVRVPNAETVAAIQAARENPSTLTKYDSPDALMADVWPEETPKHE